MDALTLHRTLREVAKQAPPTAIVNTSTFAGSYGDMEDVVKFVALRVASDCKPDTERVNYHTMQFTTGDEDILELVNTSATYTLREFIEVLNTSPAVRLGKLRLLQ